MGGKETKISSSRVPKKGRGSVSDLAKDDSNYPNQPKDDEVISQFRKMIKELHLSEAQEQELKMLPISVKWKLLCKHKENVQKYNGFEVAGEEKAQEFIEKIKCNPSLLELKNLHQWLKGASSQDIQTFLVFEGIYLLLNLLEVSELCSRSTRNYSKPLEILKILEILAKDNEGFKHLIKVPKVLDVILFNLHPIHVDLSSTAMEILSDIIWNSTEGLGAVLEALNHLKAEKGYSCRFFPFIDILNNSDNIIMIENTLAFLNSLASCPENKNERAVLREELIGSSILDSFDIIMQGLEESKYTLDCCTYEIVMEKLLANKLAKKGKVSYESKIVISEVAVTDKDMEKYQEQARTRNLKRGDTKVGMDALNKFRHSIMTDKKEEHQLDEEDDYLQKERSDNYLEPGNEKGFKKHLQGVQNQIEVFDQMLEEDESAAGLEELLSEIKENALKLDTFENLMGILQRMTLIPNTEKGKEVWDVLNEVMNMLIGTDDLNAFLDAKEVKSLIDRRQNIEELEEKLSLMEGNLMAREVEIKKLTEERTILRQETMKLTEEVKSHKRMKRSSTMMDEGDSKAQLAAKIEELKAKEVLIDTMKKEFGALRVSMTNLASELELKKSELENYKKSTENELVELRRELQIAKAYASTNQPQIGTSPPPIPGFKQVGAPPIPPQIPVPPNQTGGGPPLPPSLGGPPVPPSLGGPPKPPTLGGPPVPPTLGGPPVPPSLGGPPLPPSLGGPPKPPSIGGPPLPPALGGPPLPPSLGGPPMPPTLGGPPLPPTLGGPPMPPSLGGPPKPPSLGGPPMPPNLGGPPGPPQLPGGLKPPGFPVGGLPPLPGFGAPAQPQVKQKEKKNPSVPLKGLMWQGLKVNQIVGTIWEKIDDEKLKIDISYLEENYAAKSSVTTSTGGQKPTIIQKISTLDPNKSKNIDLILGKLKISFTAITTALLEIDENLLSYSTIESLIIIMPTVEDINNVKGYDGDLNQLANADLFVSEVSKINGPLERLKALKFSKLYKEMAEELEVKLDKMNNLWKFLKSFPELQVILEYLLACGNYLNGTSNRGGMYGFKLEALDKAADMKQNVGRRNLLQYIVEKLYEEGKITFRDSDAFEDLELAAKIPISQLKSDLAELKAGEGFLAAAINKKTDAPNDNISKVISPHLPIVQEIIARIDQKLQNAQKSFSEFIAFICENPTEPSEKVAEKLRKFFMNCQKYIQDYEKQKIEEEKKKLKESTKSIPLNSKPSSEMASKLTNKDKGKTMNDIKKETTSSIISELKDRKRAKNKPEATDEDLKNQKNLAKKESEENKEVGDIDIQRLDNILVQGILNKK